ncbi:hypothetical protein [Arthrobacter caoxuetaonis]|uniref:Uncharacterized protein n=1 Tax=Arthrobacter caoxuetaonis TaxID=2886935 RepID=A0A9X1MHJ9_9MICC|nr:hypothetical protein [Arthrobacter caoxuetaonis]MCC3299375.1 hypothetical protein [Arthrobacter caoxuetaonis]USQ59132.1 hypothetical protein NF551_18675 [Arthrobacter caoxuetaonis]
MFTAPARKMANALVNAMIFVDPKAVDGRAYLTGVRLRVRTNVFDTTATDSYLLAQGRAEGTSPGDTWSALLPAGSLKGVAASLKRSKTDASVDFDGTAVTFLVSGEKYRIETMEGVERFDPMDSLFPDLMDYSASPGYAVIDPAIAAKLGKLKDYDSANTVVDAHRPHALVLGLNPAPSKPAVAAFGSDMRILIATRRAPYVPDELSYSGWNSWMP